MPVIHVRTFLGDVRTLSSARVMQMHRAGLPLLKRRPGSLVASRELNQKPPINQRTLLTSKFVDYILDVDVRKSNSR